MNGYRYLIGTRFFFQVVGYATRNEFGYASRNSEGALRAEIWENLIRKSEKMPIDYINHLTHNHSTLTINL